MTDAEAATDTNSNCNYKLVLVPDYEVHHSKEMIASALEEVTNVVSYLNQEGADPAAISPAVSAIVPVAVAGETSNPTEVVGNSSASHHDQEPIDLFVTMPPSENGNNHHSLTGPFIITKTENASKEGSTGKETVRQEDLDSYDRPPSEWFYMFTCYFSGRGPNIFGHQFDCFFKVLR